MLNLADTSVKIYLKKNGQASLKLRSYLMVKSNIGFRLSAYLKDISCAITLPTGEKIEFYDVSYSDKCDYEMETMVHGFWAYAISKLYIAKHSVCLLRMDYHISFTGHPSEEPKFIEILVPLINRVPTKYLIDLYKKNN